MREYDLIADWYARDRARTAGLPEVQALAATLPPGALVLDVGCGTGLPLTRVFVEADFHVTGVDSSPRMLEKFRANLPSTPTICSTIQTADLPAVRFDAAISWGMLVHLPLDEQALALAAIAGALKPGGRLLFTSGNPDPVGWDANGIEGEPMDGVPFHYWSFTREGYRELLQRYGLTLLEMHQDKGQNTYYLAEKA